MIETAMKHALIGACLTSLSSAPLGVMLVLRRMSLMGDVMAHAILPGVAAGFILAGMSVAVMSLGGLAAGLLIALCAGLASRFTMLREDASLAAFYLLALATGVLLITLNGTPGDLEHILFGDAKALDEPALGMMGSVTALTLFIFGVILRPLVVESFDPVFMRSVHGRGGLYHVLFMMLVVFNMVVGYRTLGTLMAAGLMLIPAISAQFWTRRLYVMMGLAVFMAVLSSTAGLYLASSYNVPSGPAIILIAGGFYILSMLLGSYGSVRARYFPARHLES